MRDKHHLTHTFARLQGLERLESLGHRHDSGWLGCFDDTFRPELHGILDELLQKQGTVLHHRDQIDTGHRHVLEVGSKLDTTVLLSVFLANLNEATKGDEEIPGST